MQFLDAVKIAFKKYADFRGVASRPEYWWFTLFVFLVGLIAGSIDLAMGQDTNGPIQSILSIALFLPQITMTVRRNRDAGFSAWWLTLWVLPFALLATSIGSNLDSLSSQFSQFSQISNFETLSEAELVALLVPLVEIVLPFLLSLLAVSIFFFVVSLLPTKKPKQPVVASIDY